MATLLKLLLAMYQSKIALSLCIPLVLAVNYILAEVLIFYTSVSSLKYFSFIILTIKEM